GDGEIKDGSTDAINGSQLYNELSKVVAGATTINVTANGEGSQSITNHSTLDFVDGTGTKATVTSGKDGVTTVSYSVDKEALTGKIDTNNGKATASKDGFATTGDVADAINNSGFYVDGGNKTLVKNGDTVKFDAGNNLTRSQNGNTITYALSDDLSGLNSVETKTATITEKATIGGNTTISKDGIATNNVNATGTIAGKTISGDTVTTKELTADAGKIGSVTINGDGINAGNKVITGVAKGTEDSDAVNYGQLKDASAQVNNRIDNLGDRMNKAVAGTAALAALHPLDFNPDDKWSFAAGYGNYRGANAAAVGAYYQPNEDLLFSVGSSMGNGENVLNAGVSFKLGRGQHVNTTRVAMAKEIIDLRNENKNLKDRLDRLEERMNNPFGSLDMSKKVDFPDVPANHWAYQYVATLAGNGIIEGYPDNTYKGQQNITRYEMAALFYRALQNGAPIDDNMNKGLIEFSPELQDIAASRVRVDRVSGKDNDRHKVERAHVNNEDRKIKDIYGSNIKTK
ncbi:MAG: S-layer homology domain-containing protein, partial [Veillonella sp.]|nr:S-layer homology domain-containing protein [Veillonella sp.]